MNCWYSDAIWWSATRFGPLPLLLPDDCAAIYDDIRGGGVLNGAHRKGERVSWEHFVQDYFKWNDK